MSVLLAALPSELGAAAASEVAAALRSAARGGRADLVALLLHRAREQSSEPHREQSCNRCCGRRRRRRLAVALWHAHGVHGANVAYRSGCRSDSQPLEPCAQAAVTHNRSTSSTRQPHAAYSLKLARMRQAPSLPRPLLRAHAHAACAPSVCARALAPATLARPARPARRAALPQPSHKRRAAHPLIALVLGLCSRHGRWPVGLAALLQQPCQHRHVAGLALQSASEGHGPGRPGHAQLAQQPAGAAESSARCGRENGRARWLLLARAPLTNAWQRA